ncbi:hypothetical protein D4764_01G0007250 [Takifugu flavidus]|uniref:Ig-like domain-containing protein n=1 Tax=Takifugu flavidus TaxID=433684 RepID=A0A5C6PRL8_9TELE|nr:hypothetical protein D4764_01G0007250 [Takifugu flavidus]
MHNGMVVVVSNGKEEDVYDPFKHRTTLDWHSAELHLTDLRSEDSGLYELQLYMQKKPYSYYYTLQVIDKVAKPTITCETNSSKSSNIPGLLTCSAPQSDIEYEWFFYGNTQPGPQLRIFLDNKHDERVYSCRVSNPLSNETAEFTAKDCYSVNLLLLVLVLVVLVVVLVVAGVLIYRRCCKGRDNETAEEGESQLPLASSPIKVAVQSIKYGLKGQEVKLKPQIQEQQPDLILWMHNGMVVVVSNGKEEDSDIEYEWFFYGNTQPGPQLRIFLDNKHDERVYSCRVSNPLSNETAEFTAKDCYSVNLLLLVLVLVVLVVVLVVAGVLIYRRCCKGRDNETAEEGESQLPLASSPIKDFRPQSQQKRPRQGQKGSDEDDEGDEGTGLVTEVVSDEPDPAEEEASDLESPTEQTGAPVPGTTCGWDVAPPRPLQGKKPQ